MLLPTMLASCTRPTRLPSRSRSRCTAFCTTGNEKPMMNEAGSTTIASSSRINAGLAVFGPMMS